MVVATDADNPALLWSFTLVVQAFRLTKNVGNSGQANLRKHQNTNQKNKQQNTMVQTDEQIEATDHI